MKFIVHILKACVYLFACMVLSMPVDGQIITTFAGTDAYGYNGDSIAATSAELWEPEGVTTDAVGNLYIADIGNGRIRKVDVSGIITTIMGNGSIAVPGPGVPGIAVDDSGNVYTIDRYPGIWKVSSLGVISVFAGTFTSGYSGDGGPATTAELWSPRRLATDRVGNVYVSDNVYNTVRKVNAAGIITTYVGTPYFDSVCLFGGDGGPATAAQLCTPDGIAIDGAGNLFICDAGNFRIRKVDTFGVITTIAGTGIAGYSGDGGPAIASSFGTEEGIAVDNAGGIYIADSYYRVIRKINPDGTITTYAGTGAYGDGGDGGPAIYAEFKLPMSVTVDNAQQVYVADAYSNRVRKVSAPNTVTQVNTPLADITIYPSPAHEVITINATGALHEVLVSNALGQVMLSRLCNADNVEVDISALPAGVYFVKVNNMEVRKFVKE